MDEVFLAIAVTAVAGTAFYGFLSATRQTHRGPKTAALVCAVGLGILIASVLTS